MTDQARMSTTECVMCHATVRSAFGHDDPDPAYVPPALGYEVTGAKKKTILQYYCSPCFLKTFWGNPQ